MLRHFFTNSAGILTSRILGFVRDLFMAASLGAGIWSDVFFVAFKLPNLFRRLFGEGAFSQAFLPHFVKSNKKGLFLAEVLFKFSAFMLAFSLAVMLFAPLITKLLAYGFNEASIALAAPLVRINFWYLLCIFIVTLLASVLQYRAHFATSAFSTALLNIAMISALLIAYNKPQSEVALYLSWGVVAGGLLQVSVHLIAIKKLGLWSIIYLGIAKYARGKRAKISGFYKNFAQGVLGASAAQLGDFASTLIASFLASGAISYLYYANRVFQLPLALFAIALSMAIFPKISKQIKAGNEELAKKLLQKGFNFLFALLMLASIGGFVLAEPIIWLLFERGEFSAQNTKECAQVLQMCMLGLLPFGLYKLFSLWLYAYFKQGSAAKISLYSLFVNVGLCLVLFRPFGAAGIALAGSLSGFFILICALWIFGVREFARLSFNKITLATLIISIIFGFLLYYLKALLWPLANFS